MNNEKNSVIKGLAWTYAERICAQLVSLIVTVIIARVLSPTEYGIIAIVTIFTELSNVIVVNGFGTALIQKKDTTSVDFSTIFFANMIVTWLFYGVLFLLAPFIARFYGIPLLKSVLRVLGLQIPIAGVNSIQQSYISKKMEFKKFFYSTIIGTIISAIVGISLAYKGFGVWALVTQLLTNRIIDTSILVFTSGWKLTKNFSKESLNQLVSYSWKISLSSFLITLWDNVRGIVVGKKYTTEDLAFYDKGRQFPNLIASNINTSISKVLFPALSNNQDDNARVLAMTRRSIKEGTFLLTPLLFGLAACGESFIKVLLTEKWISVLPYLQVMCVIYVLQPIQTSSIQAMKAIGRSDTYLKLEIIKKIINFTILLVSLFVFNNVFIVALGALISEAISTIINFPVNKKLIGYYYIDQIKDIFSIIIIAGVMFICVFFIGKIIQASLITLIIQVIVGCFIYILLSVVFKSENYIYTSIVIKEIIKKGGR